MKKLCSEYEPGTCPCCSMMPKKRKEKKMDNKPTHTPGPWAITGADEDCDIVVAPHSRGIDQDIAKVYIPEEGGNQEANACLIAAAPDLLAFLKDKAHIFQGKAATGKDYADFLAVIAKAEGK